MKFVDIFKRTAASISKTAEALQEIATRRGSIKQSSVEDLEKHADDAFRRARAESAPSIEDLPVDFRLRSSGLFRRAYESLYPVSHAMRVTAKYGREFLDECMPLSREEYIGRGSYKFVYRLPWRIALKVCKEVLPSDPLFGSLFREVVSHPERHLKSHEIELLNFLEPKARPWKRERLRFRFHRLGLERYSYHIVREMAPDLALPTRFFMGFRYREKLISNAYYSKLTPMDSQIMLSGKHLKEFARSIRPVGKHKFLRFLPKKYDFVFESMQFRNVPRNAIEKIIEDLKRLIVLTENLARNKKLILDIHSENIIITLPEFELKIFDFHLFDEHLYEPSLKYNSPEKDHIEMLTKFLDALESI